MIEPKTKTIGGLIVKVAPFPAVEALKIKARLVKLIGPGLARLVGTIKSEKKAADGLLDGEIDGAALSGAIEGLLAQLGEEEFVALLKRLLANTSVQMGGAFLSLADDFDTKLDLVFSGKLFTIYPVVYFVLEVNFPDFFGKTGGAIGQKLQTLISNAKGKSSGQNTTGLESSET